MHFTRQIVGSPLLPLPRRTCMRERLLVSTLAVLGAAVTVVAQDGTTTDDDASNSSVWFTVLNFGLCVVLIAFSGLFSGLTLGLMGLDLIGLEVRERALARRVRACSAQHRAQIVMKADPTSKDARNARRIHPIRKRGNQLLCTLLLGNTAVNALLSITLSQIAGSTCGARHAGVCVCGLTLGIVQVWWASWFPRASLWCWVKSRPRLRAPATR